MPETVVFSANDLVVRIQPDFAEDEGKRRNPLSDFERAVESDAEFPRRLPPIHARGAVVVDRPAGESRVDRQPAEPPEILVGRHRFRLEGAVVPEIGDAHVRAFLVLPRAGIDRLVELQRGMQGKREIHVEEFHVVRNGVQKRQTRERRGAIDDTPLVGVWPSDNAGAQIAGRVPHRWWSRHVEVHPERLRLVAPFVHGHDLQPSSGGQTADVERERPAILATTVDEEMVDSVPVALVGLNSELDIAGDARQKRCPRPAKSAVFAGAVGARHVLDLDAAAGVDGKRFALSLYLLPV